MLYAQKDKELTRFTPDLRLYSDIEKSDLDFQYGRYSKVLYLYDFIEYFIADRHERKLFLNK